MIEDDPDIRRSLELVLQRAGHLPQWEPDGERGLQRFAADRADVVILDLGLPQMDGWEVLGRIRKASPVPVLILTARGLEEEKVRGLLGGADDYLTKPFSHAELIARIGALLRRQPPSTEGPSLYDDGVLSVDFDRTTVALQGVPVTLTPMEHRLLLALVRQRGQVVSVSHLLETVWGDSSGSSTDRVKSTVRSLRGRLGWSGARQCPIESVRGFGYRYRPPDLP